MSNFGLLLLITPVVLALSAQPRDFGSWKNCTWTDLGDHPVALGCSQVFLPDYEANGLEPLNSERLDICTGDYNMPRGLDVQQRCANYWCAKPSDITFPATLSEADRAKYPARYAFMWTYCTFCKHMLLTHESFEDFNALVASSNIDPSVKCDDRIKTRNWGQCGSWYENGLNFYRVESATADGPDFCYCHESDRFAASCNGKQTRYWVDYLKYSPLTFGPVYLLLALLVVIGNIIPFAVKLIQDIKAFNFTNAAVRMNLMRFVAQLGLLIAIMVVAVDEIIGFPLSYHYKARPPVVKPHFGITPLLLLVVNLISISSWTSILWTAGYFPKFKIFAVVSSVTTVVVLVAAVFGFIPEFLFSNLIVRNVYTYLGGATFVGAVIVIVGLHAITTVQSVKAVRESANLADVNMVVWLIFSWICILLMLVYIITGIGPAMSLLEGNGVILVMEVISRIVLVLWILTLIFDLGDAKSIKIFFTRKSVAEELAAVDEAGSLYHKFVDEKQQNKAL